METHSKTFMIVYMKTVIIQKRLNMNRTAQCQCQTKSKVYNVDLIKEVYENIFELISKIEESSMQNDLNEMLRLDEPPKLEGT